MLLSFRLTGSTVRLFFPEKTINGRLYLITQFLPEQARYNLGEAGPSKGVVSPPRDLLGEGDGSAKPFLRNRAPTTGCPLQTTQHRLTSSALRHANFSPGLLRSRRRWRRIQGPTAPLSSQQQPVNGGRRTRQRRPVSTLTAGFTEERRAQDGVPQRSFGGWCGDSKCVESVTCEWFR